MSSTDLDTKEGISLLSLKHHVLLSYMQSLLLLSSRRALGHSLAERSRPTQPFASADRERGSGAGDLVDSMIEGRVVLEKIKALESRMRYQIEKLVRVAEDTSDANANAVVDGQYFSLEPAPSIAKLCFTDPLAFRPNPQNLMGGDEASDNEEQDTIHHGGRGRDRNTETTNNNWEDNGYSKDGIYHPPRLAPVPYTEARKDKKARRLPVPTALSTLQDPSRPHVESTSGLGSMPALQSNRAREIQRINEFEEENFTRVIMKKKDAKRRLRDEEDIALGGSGAAGGGGGKTRRRGGGLEDEFGDVLRSVGRTKMGVVGDGYEELRKKGKKEDVLERSRGRMRDGPPVRSRDDAFGQDDEAPRRKKRTRFEGEMKAAKKKLNRGRK